MLAFRSLARAFPRATSQVTARASRQIYPFRIQPFNVLRTFTPAARFASPFSSSSKQLQGNDDALIVKLESEIQVETEDDGNEAKIEQEKALEDWVESHGWEIKDVVGEEEVILTKTQNGETITVTFSIDDINNQPVEEMEEDDEDQALEDEPLANQQSDPKSAKAIRTAPEDQVEESEPIDEDDSELRDPFPAKISINITKEGKSGAMVFEAVTQYGSINIEDFWHFEDGKLSKPANFADEGKRTKVYAGPPFGTLDVELAQLLEQYLADRGINESMAEFVTEYIEFKEVREYTRWLAKIKTFFE